MYLRPHTLTKPKAQPLVSPALPEPWPPESAVIIEDTRNLDLTGWWVEPCWLCGTWLWVERCVNQLGQALPPRDMAHGRVFEHCNSTWKVTPALFVPYTGVDRA